MPQKCLHVWSGPRCLSTSLMYSFAQRSDTEVVDEPLYAHFLRVTGAERPYRDRVLAAQDNNGERVLKSLNSRPVTERRASTGASSSQQTTVVYAKHIGKQFINMNEKLLRDENAVHFILVRDPESLIRSFSKVLQPSLSETAYPDLVGLHSALRSCGHTPMVVLSQDVQDAPEATLRAMCGFAGLPFEPAMLSWPAGPKPYDGLWAPWWYTSVHKTTGFESRERLAASHGPQEPLPPQLQELVEECAPFFELLQKRATRPPALAAPPAPPRPGPNPGASAPSSASSSADAADGAHDCVACATHSYQVDPRNESVLVGIRDGVSGKFELHQRQHAKVSVFDSGFILGDGVWEGLRLHRGVVVFAKEHLTRLFAGAKAIDMDVGATRDELLKMVYAVTDANGMTDGVHIRLMVTRGLKATPYQSPKASVGKPTVVVIAEWKQPAEGAERRGLRLFTSHVHRGAPDVQDPALNSHSKLNCIAACVQAAKAGADEALMLDPHGFVATCNSTNFLMVRDGEVWAPTTKYQMPGITRANVLRVCREAGLTVRECDFSLTQVYSADEAMVTGTFAGVLPVAVVDGRVISSDERVKDAAQLSVPGPVVTRIRALYKELVEKNAALGRGAAL